MPSYKNVHGIILAFATTRAKCMRMRTIAPWHAAVERKWSG